MKEIRLSQGVKRKKYAMNLVSFVDDADFDYLNQWTWCADKHRDTFYVHRLNAVDGKKVKVRMHRLIMGMCNSRDIVDHIDGNGLNNCRNNLRICTSSQNSMNRNTYKRKKSSKFKGVNLHKSGKWVAAIGLPNRNRKYLGWFDVEEDAAKAYDNAAKKHFGAFANLNFK